MNIVILNGSPRPHGNTAAMVAAYREGAESAGHKVIVFDVCRMHVAGCLACEYCHTKEQRTCIQKDDMQQIYRALTETDLLVLASPIYYHNISGQLKCAIDRFYSALYPTAPSRLRKVAMFLASGDADMTDGARFSYEGDFLGYLGLEDVGLVSNHDDNWPETLRRMARSL